MVQVNKSPTVNITGILASGVKSLPPLWKGSKHELWFRLRNQIKGHVGTLALTQLLQAQGFTCRKISNQGDLEYFVDGSWRKVEVKTSYAKLAVLKNGEVNQKLWFNQIRPQQSEWQEIVLVGVYPNHVRIWKMDRDQFFNRAPLMTSVDNRGHYGTQDMIQVNLLKNSNQDNFSEWNCVYNDQVGDQL